MTSLKKKKIILEFQGILFLVISEISSIYANFKVVGYFLSFKGFRGILVISMALGYF